MAGILLLVVIVSIIAILAVVRIEVLKNANPLKAMLFGIILVLFGGFFLIDQSSSLGGLEVYIMFAGFIAGIIGLFQRIK